MKKKILCLALTAVMLLCCVAMFASCGECTNHVDPDEDGKCNNCGAEIQAAECSNHADGNDDGYCDACDQPMMGGDTGTCVHEDINGDEKCDLCGADMTKKIEMKPLWSDAKIIMQLNKCSHNNELSSELQRYVAGETQFNDTVDKAVTKRNINATKETKVSVSYKYWDDDQVNGFGKTIAHIDDLVNSTTIKDAPDVYSTYIYDLVGSSVKGYFANLKGTSRGNGKLKGLNYFEFVYDKYNYEKAYKLNVEDDRGFMYEWMESVTLDPQNRMYVLASDYYIDMVRAFFMIPVNVAILEDIANSDLANKPGEILTGDRVGAANGGPDGVINLADFYAQVKAGEWTYDLMMKYSKLAYISDGINTNNGKWLGDQQVGFAMSAGGVATSGIIYTSSIKHIEKVWDTAKNDYIYFYPDNCEAYGKQIDAIEKLLKADGVVFVRRSDCTSGAWNDVSKFNNRTEHEAIRVAFGQGSVLFGDIMMVGALEETEYQKMGKRAFGVLPVPIYHSNFDENGNVIDKYLTQIHNIGRPGAIAYNTKKFVECTAYLNYQSTHSSDILNTYYTYNLCYQTVGGDAGTVDMLDYLRNNVRTSFDKAIEDAMAVFNTDSTSIKMTYLAKSSSAYVVPYIETDYTSVLGKKQGYLDDLVVYFQSAKD